MRQVPEQALALARRFEGRRTKPYLCPAGVPTIGYGHTGADVTMSSPEASEAQIELWLIEDMTKAMNAALRASPCLLRATDGQLAAIVDFVFNLGAGNYQTSTLRRRVNAGDWGGVKKELRRWVRGGGKILPGLILRREAEVSLLGCLL